MNQQFEMLFLRILDKLVFIYRCRKKSILNCWFIARDGLESIVHYLMDFSVLILYLRVINIYQICSYLTKRYWIKWQRHCWEKDGFSQMRWLLLSAPITNHWFNWITKKKKKIDRPFFLFVSGRWIFSIERSPISIIHIPVWERPVPKSLNG